MLATRSRPVPALWLATVVAVTSLLVVLGQQPAQAAPARSDSQSRPVYLVHGYAFGNSGLDCANTWSAARTYFPSWGWTGPLWTVGYYQGDTNCSKRIIEGTHDTSIRELGRQLAWRIYYDYSRYDVSVDIIAHSMGGLIARAALAGDQYNWSDWPPYVYVEDVATLGTPHKGTSLAAMCGLFPGTLQCDQMSPGSSFLSTLPQNPQSTSGTDWSLLASEYDEVVSTGSATGMSAGHKVIYRWSEYVTHSQLRYISPNSVGFQSDYWNYYDSSRWYYHPDGSAPLRAARNAIYHWSQW